MCKCVRLFAIAVLTFIVGASATAYFQRLTHVPIRVEHSSPPAFKPAVVETKPALLCDDTLLRQIATDLFREQDSADLLRYYNPETFKCSENFQTKKVDLNRDGIAEIVVQGMSIPLCTLSGNCEFWIYRESENGYELLLATGGVQQYRFLKTTSNGYRDVETSMHGSAWDSSLSVYEFDGKRYRLAKCMERSYSYIDKRGRFRETSSPIFSSRECQVEE